MKKLQNEFADLFNWAEQQDEYWVEGAKIEFAEQMLAQMDAQNISRKELASRLGTSPAYVTKILRGSTNFTIESMVNIAQALNCELCTHLKTKGKTTALVEYNFITHDVESLRYFPGNISKNTAPVSGIAKNILKCEVA